MLPVEEVTWARVPEPTIKLSVARKSTKIAKRVRVHTNLTVMFPPSTGVAAGAANGFRAKRQDKRQVKAIQLLEWTRFGPTPTSCWDLYSPNATNVAKAIFR